MPGSARQAPQAPVNAKIGDSAAATLRTEGPPGWMEGSRLYGVWEGVVGVLRHHPPQNPLAFLAPWRFVFSELVLSARSLAVVLVRRFH